MCGFCGVGVGWVVCVSVGMGVSCGGGLVCDGGKSDGRRGRRGGRKWEGVVKDRKGNGR